MIVYQAQLETATGFRENQLRLEHFTGRFSPQQGRQGLITIPVVVHIVYSRPEENLTEDQILSQIEVLNEDFCAKNQDLGGVPSIWKGVIGDAEIEFALATKDPQGAPTNGIVRVKTEVPGFKQAGNAVKRAETGGSDAWDTARYLNLWVCRLKDNLLGYAQFPGGPVDTDGVVISYSAFGRGGSAVAPFNLGRTATHEIGHFFNLFHIWGDTHDCSGTDYVSDTPNAGAPNFGKPSFPVRSCEHESQGAMFMNYMDYVDDDSMFFFTKGQIARMRATLSEWRRDLGTP